MKKWKITVTHTRDSRVIAAFAGWSSVRNLTYDENVDWLHVQFIARILHVRPMNFQPSSP